MDDFEENLFGDLALKRAAKDFVSCFYVFSQLAIAGRERDHSNLCLVSTQS
jgi:hypothetical protein